MKLYISPSAAIILGVMAFVSVLAAQSRAPVGLFDSQTDVGHVRHAGSASYDAATQRYAVRGSGPNMWGDHDDFHFVWKRLSGNFILSTRAHFAGKGIEEHRKLGWTIRPSLASNGPHVTAVVHGNGLASLQFRRSAGAT